MTKQIKLSSRGRVTIPKEIRESLDWKGGAQIEWTIDRNGWLHGKKVGAEKRSPTDSA
jgi:AbrB family looped-hinge helix DNA binding protein